MGHNRPKNYKYRGGKPPEGDLASLLFLCRTEKHLSLEEVGQAVGLSRKGVSNIERNLSIPRRTTRARLEAFLLERGYVPKEAA
jgi:transcriptional regulator with XRE-family HTH domain